MAYTSTNVKLEKKSYVYGWVGRCVCECIILCKPFLLHCFADVQDFRVFQNKVPTVTHDSTLTVTRSHCPLLTVGSAYVTAFHKSTLECLSYNSMVPVQDLIDDSSYNTHYLSPAASTGSIVQFISQILVLTMVMYT